MRPWFRKTNRRRHKSGGPSREIMRKLLCQGGIPTSYVGVPSPLHDQFRGLGRQDHIPNAHNASVRAVEEPCDRGLVVFALLDDEFTTEIHFDIILLCIGEFIDFGNNSVADPEGEVPVFSRSACQADATRRIEPHRPVHRTCTHNAFDGEVGQYEAHNITRQF